MLRLHALEERIVLDAALMVDLAGNDSDADEHEAGEEGGAAPLTALDGALHVDRVYQGVELEAP